MQSIPTLEPEVFYSSQPAKLTEHYQKLTDSYDPGVYLSLMKEVYIKRQRANRLHKKLSNIDQRYLAFARENCLHRICRRTPHLPRNHPRTDQHLYAGRLSLAASCRAQSRS